MLKEAKAQLKVPDLGQDIRREALLACARATGATGAGAIPCMDAIEAFLAVDGKAAEGGFLIMELLRTRNIPALIADGLLESVEEVWPDDRWLKPDARGYRAQLNRTGKPMALAFEDLLSGEKVSTTDGSGKRTLCVYWSSRVPKESAEITAIAAKNKDLRVLGVLNFAMRKGPDGARKLLKKAKVSWPHCYNEAKIKNPWESPYRTPRTPFFYLLDEHGNVLRFAYQWSVMQSILADLKG